MQELPLARIKKIMKQDEEVKVRHCFHFASPILQQKPLEVQPHTAKKTTLQLGPIIMFQIVNLFARNFYGVIVINCNKGKARMKYRLVEIESKYGL